MLDKVLFATDFSECCTDRGVEFLRKVKDCVREVTVLHVVDEKEIQVMVTNSVWIGETTGEYEEELRKKLVKKAREEMDRLREELEREGFKVKTIIAEGHAAEKIVRIAEEENASMIVIGSHGKSNLKAALIGSVSEDVVRKAKVPVVVVRREMTG